MESPLRFRIGTRVRTVQKLYRLPRGSIGVVTKIFGKNGLLGVGFSDSQVPRYVYCDQLEVLPFHDEKAART